MSDKGEPPASAYDECSCAASKQKKTVLLCDNCNSEHAICCLGLKHSAMPQGAWFCPACPGHKLPCGGITNPVSGKISCYHVPSGDNRSTVGINHLSTESHKEKQCWKDHVVEHDAERHRGEMCPQCLSLMCGLAALPDKAPFFPGMDSQRNAKCARQWKSATKTELPAFLSVQEAEVKLKVPEGDAAEKEASLDAAEQQAAADMAAAAEEAATKAAAEQNAANKAAAEGEAAEARAAADKEAADAQSAAAEKEAAAATAAAEAAAAAEKQKEKEAGDAQVAAEQEEAAATAAAEAAAAAEKQKEKEAADAQAAAEKEAAEATAAAEKEQQEQLAAAKGAEVEAEAEAKLDAGAAAPEPCGNGKCTCTACTCGSGCTCNVSPDVSCDPCKDYKAEMMAKKAEAGAKADARGSHCARCSPRAAAQ